jgi:3-methyl-2-oxobutanoate hydroxymethyltransferase
LRVRRLTAREVRKRKTEPFAVMTAYDAAFARIAEAAGIDVILVGDSLGMVVLGYAETTSVELSDIVRHTGAVVRSTERAHVIADLPFGSYQASDEDAVHAAIEVVKKGGASSVKLEGGAQMASRVRAIVDAGIPVMAHIGVLPQTAALETGYGKRRDAEKLMADARAFVEAGAYALLLEMVDDAVAAQITSTFPVPTVGIGAGPSCDGQVLVLHDVLGLFPDPPSFVRRYADLATVATDALRNYAEDVKARRFPESARSRAESLLKSGA